MKSAKRPTTVDDLLRSWERSKEQNKPAAIDDLSADVKQDATELRERLQAVASMMSFLGVNAESGSNETADVRPSERVVIDTLSAEIGSIPHVLLRDTDGVLRRRIGWRRPPGPSTKPWRTRRGCSARPGRHHRPTRVDGQRRWRRPSEPRAY